MATTLITATIGVLVVATSITNSTITALTSISGVISLTKSQLTFAQGSNATANMTRTKTTTK